jgi:hypothetical protein
MRIAVTGSRSLESDIAEFIPQGITEMISGGAQGIDTIAERWADENNVPKLIIRPNYARYGKAAPLVRSRTMVRISDLIVAVWDGKSRGTKYCIEYARRIGKPVKVYMIMPEGADKL